MVTASLMIIGFHCMKRTNTMIGWADKGGTMLYLVFFTSSYNYNSLYGPCPQGIV